MGYNCLFTDIGVTIFIRSDDSIAFKGVLDGKLYLVDFNDNNAELDTCLIARTNMGWLWCDTPGVYFVLCRETYPNLGCSVKISISLSHISPFIKLLMKVSPTLVSRTAKYGAY